jgi:hypothetical protein
VKGARSIRTAVVVVALALATTVEAAAPPVTAAQRVLEYAVIDTANDQELYRLRGWSEDTAGLEVVAVSQVIFPAGNFIEIHMRFTRETPPRCVSWEAMTHDRNGEVVARIQETLVPDTFPFLRRAMPVDTYPPVAPLGYVLTRLGLGDKERASFHMILMGSSILGLDLWVDGREEVPLPAGRFDCYRVKMRVDPQTLFPDLPGFARPFVSLFIPTHTLWLTTAAPQMLVKFTGQMGPPGSPRLRVDLLSVTEPPAAGTLQGDQGTLP